MMAATRQLIDDYEYRRSVVACSMDKTYRAVLSASGAICAMVNTDKIIAERVVAAINEAIVSRV
jgi:hypothetical protein